MTPVVVAIVAAIAGVTLAVTAAAPRAAGMSDRRIDGFWGRGR